MSYAHLITFDRGRIESLINEGESLRSIARKLKVSPSTISREVKRNRSVTGYTAEVAHKECQKRKQRCGRSIKATTDTLKKIQDHLNKRWSPEQIAFGLFNGELSFKTIYRWIYTKMVDFSEEKLRYKVTKESDESLKRLKDALIAVPPFQRDLKKRGQERPLVIGS